MARKKLTDNLILKQKPAKPGTRIVIMDTEHPRTGLRVTETGHKSFVYVGRFGDSPNPTRRHLGDYPTTTLARAREKARRWDELLALGVDPKHEEHRLRVEKAKELITERMAVKNVFALRAQEYLRDHCKHHRQASETGRLVRKHLLPVWGERVIDTITPTEIKDLIRDLAARSPSTARNVLTVCKSLFDWCLEEASPAAAIKPKRVITTPKKPRQRILSDDEIVKFWDATGKLAYPYQHLYRLLILTGVRLREAANAPWAEINFDRRLWVIEPERFKSDCRHVVPLSDQAMQLIKELPRFGDYLFTINGKRPINSFSKTKARLDELMGVSDWRVHDLRRVVRSNLSALRVPRDVAEMVIGHGKRGLDRIYDQYQFEPELRDALQQWANKLRNITTPPPPNLVLMNGKKRRKRA